MKVLYKSLAAPDSSTYIATNIFAGRSISDVLAVREKVSPSTTEEVDKDEREILMPNESILIEPVVAVVDKQSGE